MIYCSLCKNSRTVVDRSGGEPVTVECPMCAEHPATPAPRLFYIQNRGYCGNCLRFWRKGGHGYTSNLREAWKVPHEKALEICRSRPEEDIMWPVEVLEAIAEVHVNCEPARAAGVRL